MKLKNLLWNFYIKRFYEIIENPSLRVYLGASKNKEKFYERFGFVKRIDANLGYGMILKDRIQCIKIQGAKYV